MKTLLLLQYLQSKAVLRRLKRGLKSVKGILVLLFFAMISLLMLLPLFMGTSTDRSLTFDIKPYFSFGVFAYLIFTLLTSVGDRVLYFSPAEVDHLFPAPIGRKVLLGYKIFGWFVMAIYTGGLFSVAMSSSLPVVIYSLVGLTLTAFFMSMPGMLIALLGQIFSEHVYTRGRKIFALVVLGILAMGVPQAFSQPQLTEVTEIKQWIELVSNSTVGQIVLAPFDIFRNTVFATEFTSFMCWGGIAALINIGLVCCALVLDANYLETAAKVSDRIYTKLKRKGAGAAKVSTKASRWKLRMFPFVNGFGPIAWRQIVSVLRQGSSTTIMAVVVILAMAVSFLLDNDSDWRASEMMVGAVFGAMAYVALLASIALPLGFKADIDHLEVFKALPLSPFCVAAGQLAGPVLLMSAFHFTMAVVGVLLNQRSYEWWFTGRCLSSRLMYCWCQS